MPVTSVATTGRPLAIASEERLQVASSIPTFAELGYPKFAVTQWYGLMAPKGTPADVVDKLSRAVKAALETPDVADKLRGAGTEPEGSTPAEFASFLDAQIKQWGTVARSVGARLE